MKEKVQSGDSQKINLLKQIMETKEYKECETQINTYKDHSKLRKLYEILICFFTVGKTREQSKVIIFTQFRESAKEIKEYIDR
jgi:ERCC4-related helicase